MTPSQCFQLRPSPTCLIALARWMVASAILSTGCAHHRPDKGDGPRGDLAFMFDTRPPEFLIGPMSALLPGPDGISAQLTFTETGVPAPKMPPLHGTLLGRDGWFLFQPQHTGPRRRKSGPEGMLYSFDVNHGTGFVMSEALLGYAPFTTALRHSLQHTNAPMPTAQTMQIEGHTCVRETITVHSGDGTAAAFSVWRAEDLHHWPLRIISADGTNAASLELTQVHPDTPRLELFQPPADFTRYDSVEAMMNELSRRQWGSRPGRAGRGFGPPPSLDGRPPGPRGGPGGL